MAAALPWVTLSGALTTMLNAPARPRGPVIGLLTFLFAVTLQSQAPPLPLPSTPLIFAGSGRAAGCCACCRPTARRWSPWRPSEAVSLVASGSRPGTSMVTASPTSSSPAAAAARCGCSAVPTGRRWGFEPVRHRFHRRGLRRHRRRQRRRPRRHPARRGHRQRLSEANRRGHARRDRPGRALRPRL